MFGEGKIMIMQPENPSFLNDFVEAIEYHDRNYQRYLSEKFGKNHQAPNPERSVATDGPSEKTKDD